MLIWSWVVDSGKLKGHGPDDGPSHEKTGLVSPDAVGVLYSVGFVSGPGVGSSDGGDGGACQHALLRTSASPPVRVAHSAMVMPPVHVLHQPSPIVHWMAKHVGSASHALRQACRPAASLPMPGMSCHVHRSRCTLCSSMHEPPAARAAAVCEGSS